MKALQNLKGIYPNPANERDHGITYFAEKLALSYDDKTATSDPIQSVNALLIEAVNLFNKHNAGLSMQKAENVSMLDINDYITPDFAKKYGLPAEKFNELYLLFIEVLKVIGDSSEAMITPRTDFYKDISNDQQDAGYKLHMLTQHLYSMDKDSRLSDSGKVMAMLSGVFKVASKGQLSSAQLRFLALDVIATI